MYHETIWAVTDGYDKTWYRVEENVKKDIWTSGRGRNIENKN